MIEIPRSLARRLSAVIRSCIRKPYMPRPPVVDIHTDTHELCVRVCQGDVAVEYRQIQEFRPVAVLLPIDALAAFEGRDESPVVLEPGTTGQTIARWTDAGVPQVMGFGVADADRPRLFPVVPEQFVRNEPALLTALSEAARSTAAEATRYGLNRLLLSGRTGEVVGTDSKQLYVHGGFQFGWTDDVLVPRVMAFGRPELGPAEAVEVGRTDEHVAVRVGPWTIFLTIDTTSRFPAIDLVVPKPSAATTTCHFPAGDVEFLVRSLPRLPGKADESRPLTVDLNGQVCVRARSADQPQASELVLAGSTYTGPATRLNLNRDHLARAFQLGFTELRVVQNDKPVFCCDDKRTYLMMPLSPSDAVAPSNDVLRFNPPVNGRALRVYKTPREKPMSTPTTNGSAAPTVPARRRPPDKNRIGLVALIAEAQALREKARDTFAHAGRLVVALKRHRQQSRLMASTLKSLKQLQHIDG